MAKNDKFKLKGNSATDDDLDFGLDDFESDIGKNVGDSKHSDTSRLRAPIDFTKGVTSSTFKSTAKNVFPSITTKIGQHMPNSARLLGEANQAVSDLSYMKNEFVKDIQPSINELKRAGQTLGPKIKPFLPKFAQKWYDKATALEPSHDNAKLDKEDARKLQISGAISNIFDKQLDAQKELAAKDIADRKEENLITRQLEQNRHNQSYAELSRVRVATEFGVNYRKNIQLPYYKQMLELKYKHLFTAMDTQATLTTVAKTIDTQLDAIRHNTGLPDYQKINTAELLKEELSGRTTSAIADYVKGAITRIKDKVLDPFKSGLSDVSSGMSALADVSGMTDDPMFGTPISGARSAGNLGGDLLGSILGSKFGKSISKVLFGSTGKGGAIGRKARNIDELFANTKVNTLLKIQDYAENTDSGLIGTILDVLNPGLEKGSGSIKNVFNKDPNKQAPWTNQSHITLNQIIPGLLAKQLQQLEQLNTGKPADELVYDAKSNDFIRSSAFKANVITEAFGTKSSRAYKMGQDIGQIRGTYKTVTGEIDTTTFDSFEEDLAKFITNSALYKQRLKPEFIKEFAGILNNPTTNKGSEEDINVDDDGIDFESDFELNNTAAWKEKLGITSGSISDYIDYTMKGVKRPGELCLLLANMFYSTNGTKNIYAINLVNNAIISRIADDTKVQDIIGRYAAQGSARHLKSLISASGNSFKLSDDEVLKQQQDISKSDVFSKARDYSTDTASALFKEILDSDSEGAKTIKERLLEELKDTKLGKSKLGKQGLEFIEEHSKAKFSDTPDEFLSKDDTVYNRYMPSFISRFIKERISPKMTQTLEKMKATTSGHKGKVNPLYKPSGLEDIYDPFISQDENSTDNIHPFIKSKYGRNKGGMVLPKSGIINTKIINVSEIAANIAKVLSPLSKLKSEDSSSNLSAALKTLYTTTNPLPVTVISQNSNVPIGSDASVNAITRFENTFKEYANEQKEFRKLVESIGTTVAGLGDVLNIIVGNTTGTFTKLWRKLPGKSDITNKINQLWDSSKEKYKGIFSVGSYIKDKFTTSKDYLKEKGKSGYGYLGDKTAKGYNYLLDKGKKVGTGIGGLALSALALGLGGYDKTKEKFGGLGASLRGLLGTLEGKRLSAKEKLGEYFSMQGVKKKISNFSNRLRYINVYLKDQVEPDKPLLSMHDQEEGVFFDDGKQVKTTYDIDRPVYDKNNQVKISSPNLAHGIVDVHNNPIKSKGGFIRGVFGGGVGILKGAKNLAKGALGAIGDILSGQNPLLKMYGSLLKFGGKMTGAIGGGLLNGVRRFFGGGDLTKADIKDLVTTRLDTIIELLKGNGSPIKAKPNEQLTGGYKLSDTDKDGDVDTAMEARATQTKAKEEKEERSARLSVPKFLKRIADKLDKNSKEEKKHPWLDKLKDMLFSGLGIFGKGFWNMSKALLKGFGNFLLLPLVKGLKFVGTGVMALMKAILTKGSGAASFDTSPDDFLNDKKKGRNRGGRGRAGGRRGVLGRMWDGAKNLGSGIRGLGGRAAGAAVGIGLGAMDMYDIWSNDNLTDEEKRQGYAGAIGSMGGGAAGAMLGGAAGSVLGPAGTVVGGLVGGAVGSIAGEAGLKWASDKIFGGTTSGDGEVTTLPDGVKITRPTNSDVITSPFGPRNVRGGSPNHRGIDIRAAQGDPIFAISDGVVTVSQNNWGMIEIHHVQLKVRARYMHLSARLVNVGDKVSAGQQIGRAGGVGGDGKPNAYIPHLHFDVRNATIINYTKGCPVYDPEQWFSKLGIKFTRKDGSPSSDAGVQNSLGNRYIPPHRDANGKVVDGSIEKPANATVGKDEFPFNPNATDTGSNNGIVSKGTSAFDALKGGGAFAGTEFGRNLAAASGGTLGSAGAGTMLASGASGSGGEGGAPSIGDSTPSQAGQQNTSIDASGLGNINVANKDELAAQFMNSKLTRGRRNNNPGNVTVSSWTKAQPGYVDGDRIKGGKGIAEPGKGNAGFARFSAPEHGIRAAVKLIKDTYGKQGLDTISKITYKYSPPHENDTAGLIRKYSAASGFKPDEKINWNNQEAVVRYIAAKIKAETGYVYPDDVLKRGVMAAYDGGANGTTNVSEGGIESTIPTPDAAGGEGAIPSATPSVDTSAPKVVDGAVDGSSPLPSLPSTGDSSASTPTPISTSVPAPTSDSSTPTSSHSGSPNMFDAIAKNLEYLPMIYSLLEKAVSSFVGNNANTAAAPNTTNRTNYPSSSNSTPNPLVSVDKPRRGTSLVPA